MRKDNRTVLRKVGRSKSATTSAQDCLNGEIETDIGATTRAGLI